MNQEKLGWELRRAANDGDLAKVETLLSSNATVNSQHPLDGWSALHYASWKGHQSVVESLLNSNADINQQDGATPLHLASRWGRAAVVKLSLARNADPTIKDKGGRSARDYAVQATHQDVVNLLDDFQARQIVVKRAVEAEKGRIKAEEACEVLKKQLEQSESHRHQAQEGLKNARQQLEELKKDLLRITTGLNERDRDVIVGILKQCQQTAQAQIHTNGSGGNDDDDDVNEKKNHHLLHHHLHHHQEAVAQSAVLFYQQWSDTVPKSLALELIIPAVPTILQEDLVVRGSLGGGEGASVMLADWTIKTNGNDGGGDGRGDGRGGGGGGTCKVAWKIPHPEQRGQGEKEALLWMACPPHPNVITLRAQVRQRDGDVFNGVVMDLWDRSLEKVKLPASELIDCARQITRGLAHLHACRILHRDLAPRNILIRSEPGGGAGGGGGGGSGGGSGSTRYAITDFGLSRAMNINYLYLRDADGATVPWRTLAPEIHRAYINLIDKNRRKKKSVKDKEEGKEKYQQEIDRDKDRDRDQEKDQIEYGKPSDIWALGVTLWELATNQKAYSKHLERGTQAIDIQAAIGKGEVKLNVDDLVLTHRELAPAIIGCLQHDPKSRPTATQVLLLLRDVSTMSPRC